ncbi:MAG: ketoacyl-ACP synthase III [Nitrospirae bacterium]|nr:ketoacyl-ACP synthase III [Candidatus Troglogloeales bacterium]
MKAKIIGTGSYAPSTVLTNKDLEQKIDTSDKWIVERTGVRERRIAAKDTATSDLALKAAQRALNAADVSPSEVDLIIVGTTTPDMFFPSTACLVLNRLGATRAAAFDLSAACSGFIYALSVGEQYILSGKYKKVLVIGADLMSRIVNWTDRSTAVLFGDGAGAVLLAPVSGKHGILSTHIHSDGSLWDLIAVPGGGSADPPSEQVLVEKRNTVKMKGSETFKAAVRTLEEVARETLSANGVTVNDLAHIVPHQANIRIIKAVAERLDIDIDKVVVNLSRYGNTSAASIPLALDEAVRDGNIKENDLILLLAFGSGLTWGSALIRW